MTVNKFFKYCSADKIRSIVLVAAMCVGLSVSASTPKVVAHRGFWNTDGSAQNSIAALVKADSVGCYAAEFDIWMTADGVLVVNHDATINGVVIEDSNSEEVLAQRLTNGETVPTLESYLLKARELDCRLVCELKEHSDRRQESKAVKALMEMIGKYGLSDRVDFITFSKDAFGQMVRQAPEGAGVYYLTGDYLPAQVKAMGGAGIDYSMRTIRRNPEWIKDAHDLGLLVNIWTVNDPADMQWCIDEGADFITTNEPLILQQLIAN